MYFDDHGLYNNLVSSALVVIELEEDPEEDNPALPSNEKDVALVKGKGKGKKVLALTSSQVSNPSFTKASVQRIVDPATTVVGSPTATPFAPGLALVVAPSHSGATIPSLHRKRKAIAPDTSVSSLDRSSSVCLLENVDMEKLIEDFMKTKVLPPASRCGQEILTKVCVLFNFFVHSFFEIEHLFFLIFSGFLLFRLERAVLVKTQSLRFTLALSYCLRMCLRTYVYQTSRPHPRMFLSGTNDLPLTLKFFLHLQMPTFLTTASLSLHMPLILKSLDQFTTGHTLRNSTLAKTGLA